MLQLFVSNWFFLLLEHNNTVCTISDLFGDFFFVWLSLVYHFRTSYALMSQWMMQLGNRSKAPVEGYVSQPNFPAKHSAGNVYGRRSRMVNSDGAPSPYNPDAAQLAAVRSLKHHSTEHRAHDSWWQLSILKTCWFFFFAFPLRWTNPFLHTFDSPQTTDTTTSTNLTSKSASSSQTNTSQYLVHQSESFWPSFFNCLWRVNSVAICYSGCWVYPHRLRHGRAGGSWRHVKEVLQAGGRRIVFVDGRYDRLGIGIVSKRVLVCNLHWEFTECRKFILYWLEK